ncbi:MAG: hypothetical protein NW215_00690 [Hyphomicrobiales bacterium]|nr:hypothetical protein [Hyphomicrobiales bacterium]
MTDFKDRAVARYQEAIGRGRAATPLSFHPNNTLNLYAGLFKDLSDLAKLNATEEGDREAIRAHFELARLEIERRMREVELAIESDREAFDALRADNTAIVNKLIELGHVDAAIALQTRFLEIYGGSTLDKLMAGRKR